MKTKLKNRIVSGLLAFAMTFSLLPAGLLPSAHALTVPELGTMNVTEDAFSVSFTVSGKGNTNLGLYRFILVPDASTKGATSTPSYQVGRGFSDQNGATMVTSLESFGAPSRDYYYYVDNAEARAFVGDTVRFPASGTISMPKSFSDTITYLASNGFVDKNGRAFQMTDTSIPMVALFYQQQGTPTAASAIGSWGGKNPAQLVFEGEPNASGGNTTTAKNLNDLYGAIPLTLTNVGGEPALIAGVKFSTPSTSNTALFQANYWTLWYQKEAVKWPIFVNATDCITILPGESVMVWMLRRQTPTGGMANTVGSQTINAAAITGTNPASQIGGTITVTYDSMGASPTNGLTVTKDWSYTTSGYGPTSIKLITNQYDSTGYIDGSLTYTGTVPAGGITINSAYFADENGNATVEILGKTVAKTATSAAPTSIGQMTDSSTLPIRVKAADYMTADPEPGTTKQLTIKYNDGSDKEVKVNVTVVVNPVSRSADVTVYRNGTASSNIWTDTDRNIGLTLGGVLHAADSSANGVFSFNNLPNGTYDIVEVGADGVSTTPTNETITVTDAQGTGKVEYYDFAMSAGTGGTVSGTADGTYLKGTTVTATATANSGYRFVNWSGTGLVSGNPPTSLTTETNIVANFEVIGLQWQTNHNPAQNTKTWTIGAAAPTWTKIIAEQVGATGDIGDITYEVTGTVPGLTITATKNDGVTITGTPTTAAGSPFTVTVKASAANGQSITQNFVITVNKQALPKPTGSGKDPTVNNASDGEITWTNRDRYPAGTTATLKDSGGNPVGTWDPTNNKWTGLPEGTYTIEVTNPDPNKYTLTDPTVNVTLTDPAANDPTIADETRTYERNSTERGASATYTYSITTGNWDGIGAVSIGSGAAWVTLPAAAWSFAGSTLTLTANELDKVAGLRPGTLANGGYTLKVTFTDSKGLQGSKDIEGGTLNVKTTYVLNYNAGTGVTDASLPATAKNAVTSGNAAGSFTYASATRPGYTLVGWSTNGADTNAEWTSGSWAPNVTVMNSTVYAVWEAVDPSGTTKDFTGTVGTAFTSDFEVIQIKVSNKPTATFSYTHGGTAGLPDLSAYGLTLKEDTTNGRIIIEATTPTHATANEGWVSFSFTATEQETGASKEFTFRVKVYKQTLTPPTLAVKNHPAAAGTATGAITMTTPTYPAGAGTISYTLDGNSTPAVTGPGDITGLLAGTYKVKATLTNTNDYKWATPITGETASAWSNSVDLTDPGINRPTVANSQTFEKNTAVTGRTTSFTFTFNTKDWTTVDGVQIGSHTLAENGTTGYTVNYDAGTAAADKDRTGTITVPVSVLDALDPQLANGNATVTVTFGRTGGTADTRTDTATCTLKVQTTYIVSFADYDGGTLNPAVSSIRKTVTNDTIPTFVYGDITFTSAPTKDGYKYAGWTKAAKATPSTGPVEWSSASGKTSYTPAGTGATDKTAWNTTVYATWTANVVTITVYKNGDPNTDKNYVLVKGSDVVSNGVRGGAGNNVITFSAVPAGEYSIELGDGTSHTATGHKVTASAGTTVNHDLHYYDVQVAKPVVTGTSTLVVGGDSYIKATGTTTVELLTEGTNDNAIIRASITDPNYDFKAWSQKPAGGTLSGNATNGTFKLTAKSTSVKGPIVLTPEYQKNRYDVTVIVKRNGEAVAGQTVTWAGADQMPLTDANGTMTIHGVSTSVTPYVVGVKGWTGTTDVRVNGKDQTITLNYYDYHFNANLPAEAVTAGNSASGMPSDPAAPVLTGYTVTQPTAPSLAGYTFRGWATSAAGPAATWGNINTITAETTFYAIWQPNTVTLGNMTAYGALNVTGIRGFSANEGSGTGHDADNDFTYEVWNGTAWANTHTQDGITLNAGNTFAFAANSAPTKAGSVAAPVATSVFYVRAVSKLNGQVSAATSAGATTVTVTIQPTYKVQYDKNTGGNDGSVSGSVPTDSNFYVVATKDQDFTGAQGSGGETVVSNTVPASATRLTWAGGARTQTGWASSSTGAVASSFQASAVASAQKVAPGGTLTLYAIWVGKGLTVNSQEIQADYNMNGDQWKVSDYYTAGQTPDINLTGLYLPGIVSHGTNANNLTFNVTDIPAFMEYDSGSKTLKLKDNTRVGNAGTYTITVEVTDSGNSNAKATGTVKLIVHQTTPVIMKSSTEEGLGTTGESTYYANDLAWDAMTYYEVRDPYDPTKVLSQGTQKETHKGRWSSTTQKITAGTKDYPFTYTDPDTTNYTTATKSITLTAVERAISLQVKDNKAGAVWTKDYTNSQTPTYDPTAQWETMEVSIRLPATGNNSDIEKLTWVQNSGTGDTAFRNIKVVENDKTTTRTAPDTLTKGDTGEYILIFEVNVHASGSHTLKYTFTGEAGIKAGSSSLTSADATAAGDKLGSYKTVTATYTYTTVAQANKLETPDPDLTRVEVKDGIEHPDGSNDDTTINYTNEVFKDQNGNTIDEKMGGLHLIFKPIEQDNHKNDASNPVKHYVVTLTGNKVGSTTPNSITITPDQVDEDGYFHYYWQADLTKGPIPDSDYTVEVQAFSRDTNLYHDSDKGDDATKAGFRELPVTNWGQLSDKVFNGKQQNGGSLKAPTGAGAITVRYYKDSSDPAATLPLGTTDLEENQLHVNIDPENSGNEYAVYVTVAKGTLYLPIEEPTLYPYAGSAAGNDPYWKITQATAEMTLTKSKFTGQTMQTVDLRPGPKMKYKTGNPPDHYYGADGTTNAYYDFVYTITRVPAGSAKWTVGQTLTEAELEAFVADVTDATGYKFKAAAVYKTDAERNPQFEADVGVHEAEFTFTTTARTVAEVKLERYEAWNGAAGAAGVDTDIPDGNQNLSEVRAVTYGTPVAATADRDGYYDATNNGVAKQMRLEGLRITVIWTAGDPDVYVVGTDTLPDGMTWHSSNASVTAPTVLSDYDLDFKGAGISTNLSVSYGGVSSTAGGKKPVVYTMAKRPIDYTVVSGIERIWTNVGTHAKVDGHIEFTLPNNLNGDQVSIPVTGDGFQTTNQKYDTWVANGSDPYPADTAYTANGDVGKDKLVHAVNAGTSGSGADVAGTDKAFYKTGKEIPGKASIIPRLVNTITLTTSGVEPGKKIVDATINVVLNDGEGNRGLEQSNPIRYSSGKIQWQILKDGGDPEVDDDWETPTDETFLSNRKYRPRVEVQADTNHYLELSDKYTLNGYSNGQRTEDDNRFLTTVTVESDNPYHPDWLPDREVLYHNIAVFQGIIDLTVTPELQFADFKSSDYDFENYDADKAHHKFQANTVHIESVSVGESLGKYNIDLRADVLSVWDVSVAKPNGNLLDVGGILTPLTDTKVDGEMKYRDKDDMIRYELDLSGVATDTPGEYILTLTAKGSAKEGTKANDIQASYTFALVVSKAAPEPTPMPVESIIVLYWVSLKGKTNDLTGEKIPASGGRPTFVPKIVGLDGWVFKGWSETDPTLLKDGEKPKLVDPLKITLTEDKIYYAYYEKEEVDHVHFVRGYPDGSFRPDNYITRAEVATIIARSCLEGFEEGHDYGNPGGYSDIGTKRWYTSAVSYCSMAGVFAGYPDGTFRPNEYITRQELALVVGRLAGLRVNMGLPFEDADTVNKWARDGVYTCYILGYVDGYKDGTFRPKNDITRAETVKIFNGYLNRGVDAKGLEGMTPFQLDASAGSYQINGTTEYLTWEDVPEKHWAYYEIIEASNDHDFHWPEDENDTSKKDAPPEDWDAVYIEAEWRYRTTYAITWSVAEGMVAETTTKVGLNKAPVAPEVTADEGRVFLGWALTEGGEVVDLTTMVITGAQTFYGVFADDGTEPEKKTFTVSFETGEWAYLEGESTVTVEENGVLTTMPAAIATEGHLFHGWSLTIGGEVVDPTTIIVTEDLTFYAVCEEKSAEPKTFIVTFVSGEQGDLTGDTMMAVEEGSFLTDLPAVTVREGYEFLGWALAEGGQAVDPLQLNILEDTLFYALYEEQAQTQPETPDTFYIVKAYIDGYEDGTFRPKEHITRAVVAGMIARAYGSDFDENRDYDLSAVSDISPDHPAAKAIGYCLEKGYFSGYPDGTFAPDGTMTRQEFAVVIAKLAGVQENQGLPFTDADSINKWARDYVYTVYVNGWITGYNDGTFKPKNLITRAEAVKIFNAFLGRSTTKESFDYVTEFDHVWSDFSAKNWAYPDIMEATNDHFYYLNEDGVAIWVDPSVVEALTSGETQTSEETESPEEDQDAEDTEAPQEG